MLPDNQRIAILTKFNNLAERFDIQPYEIETNLKCDEKTGKVTLNIEDGFPDEVGKKIVPMLDAMLREDQELDGAFEGTSKEIVEILDQALAKAPRLRTR